MSRASRPPRGVGCGGKGRLTDRPHGVSGRAKAAAFNSRPLYMADWPRNTKHGFHLLYFTI